MPTHFGVNVARFVPINDDSLILIHEYNIIVHTKSTVPACTVHVYVVDI